VIGFIITIYQTLHLPLQAKSSGKSPEEYEKKGDLAGVSYPLSINYCWFILFYNHIDPYFVIY
jgi:hypothetical protein